MHLFLSLSDYLIPGLILSIILYGLYRRIDIYDSFIFGAKDGLLTVIKILPTLIGLMTAVGVLRASGFLDFLASCICCHWSASRYLPHFRSGLTTWTNRFSASMLYRDHLLHHERLFYDCKNKEITLYSARCTARNLCRTGSKRSVSPHLIILISVSPPPYQAMHFTDQLSD